MVLAEEPLCRLCLEPGLIVASREVDHIIAIAKRPDLRLVRSNLRGLCKACHSAITAEQVGWTTKSRVQRKRRFGRYITDLAVRNATIVVADFRLDREHIGAVADAVPVDSEFVEDSQQQV